MNLAESVADHKFAMEQYNAALVELKRARLAASAAGLRSTPDMEAMQLHVDRDETALRIARLNLEAAQRVA